MATAAITGGADGIGHALAETYLERGRRDVLIIGASADKGQAFLAAPSAPARGIGHSFCGPT